MTAVFLIAFPFVGIVFTLIAYSVVSYSIKLNIETGRRLFDFLEPQTAEILLRICSILFGLLGIASLLGFFITIPIGIYLLMADGKSAKKV